MRKSAKILASPGSDSLIFKLASWNHASDRPAVHFSRDDMRVLPITVFIGEDRMYFHVCLEIALPTYGV